MGKKKGRTFKVQKTPPHKGAVILTGKQTAVERLFRTIRQTAKALAEAGTPPSA